jgi:PilZ domain
MSFHEKLEPPQRAKRARVLMFGVLVTPVGTQKVTIRDISRIGAQVAGKDEIPKDCDVLLKRGSLFAAARVAWVSGNEAGIHFYRELSPGEVEGTLPGALMRESS